MRSDETRKEEKLPDTAGKTETFLTRNVRTITFLTCIAIFLAFFGPVSVFTIGRIVERRNNAAGNKPMTAEETMKLADAPASVTFDLLRKYDGRYHETETTEVYYIEFGHYLMLATRDKTSGELSVLLENLENGERINFLKDNVRAFYEGATAKGEETA